MTFEVDPARMHQPETGILVRAVDERGRVGNHDIAHLDTASLDTWLRSRDGIEWPISVVKLLLGHPRGGRA